MKRFLITRSRLSVRLTLLAAVSFYFLISYAVGYSKNVIKSSFFGGRWQTAS